MTSFNSSLMPRPRCNHPVPETFDEIKISGNVSNFRFGYTSANIFSLPHEHESSRQSAVNANWPSFLLDE